MRVVMLSDVHLVHADEPAQRALVGLVDSLRDAHLYVLGDLFHFWWGWPGFVDAEMVPVLSALLRARDRGVRLTVVPGNHDWQLGPFFTERLGARVQAQVREPVGNRRALLVHGDEADRSWGYRLTRTVLRGPGFAALMRALGPQAGQRLGLALAGGSRRLGGDGAGVDRGVALLARQRSWAQAQLGPEVDLVVMGHSHQATLEALPGGLFVNLGDFARERRYLVLDPAPRLLTWEA